MWRFLNSIRIRRAAAILLLCTGSVSSVLIARKQAAEADREQRTATFYRIHRLLEDRRYQEAERRARELLQELSQAPPDRPEEIASVIDLLVASLVPLGRQSDPAVKALAERAVVLKEQSLGELDPRLATSLKGLAAVSAAQGDHAAAVDHHRRAVDIWKSAFGRDHVYLAIQRNNLANLLVRVGAYEEAESHLSKALVVLRSHLGEQHPELARCRNNLGLIHLEAGNFVEARRQLEAGLAIRRATLGPEDPELAGSLSSLGKLHFQTGDYHAARELQREALSIREAAADPAALAGTLNDLANLLRVTGDHEGARKMYQRALVAVGDSPHPDRTALAKILGNLGNLYYLARDFPQAADYLGRALQLRQDVSSAESLDLAEGMSDLANILATGGKYDEARELHRRALAVREQALGPEHFLVAESLRSLALLAEETGSPTDALELHRRSLTVQEASLGPDHPFVASHLRGLADLLSRLGETEEALRLALRTEEISRAHVRLTAQTLPEREALGYAAVRFSGLDLALSLVLETEGGERIERVWDAVIRSRGLVLDEMAARHRSYGAGTDSALGKLEEKLARANTRMANLSVRGGGGQSSQGWGPLLQEARAEKEAAESALAAASRAFRGKLRAKELGWREVRDQLPPDGALVSYVFFDRSVWRRDEGVASVRTVPSYLALVYRRGQAEPTVAALGPAAEIHREISRWREVIALEEGDPLPELKTYRSAAGALREVIWDPIVPFLGEARLVLVVPDGALHLVNLSTLPWGDTDYLAGQAARIHYLVAERDVASRPAAEKPSGGLLAVGNPDINNTSVFAALSGKKQAPGQGESSRSRGAVARSYRGRRSSCTDFQRLSWEPIPGAEAEAKEIVELWRRLRRPGMGLDAGQSRAGDGPLLLTGAEASESSLKALMPGRRMLHLATHGFVVAEQCSSALQEDDPVELMTLSLEWEPAPEPAENPLWLSGLVLAGGNHRSAAGPDEEDGILTAEEIASLDLSGVEWAVLSACESGLGQVRAGEGVLGLQRAFQVAGAETVIMSLWSVSDVVTRAWMRQLYESRLEGGRTTAESVRLASLALLRDPQTAHPFYWGAFLATGNWR